MQLFNEQTHGFPANAFSVPMNRASAGFRLTISGCGLQIEDKRPSSILKNSFNLMPIPNPGGANGDIGAGEMKKGFVVLSLLLPANEDTAKTIHPTMRVLSHSIATHLNTPTARAPAVRGSTPRAGAATWGGIDP